VLRKCRNLKGGLVAKFGGRGECMLMLLAERRPPLCSPSLGDWEQTEEGIQSTAKGLPDRRRRWLRGLSAGGKSRGKRGID
jgi:hypothetical protein